MARVVKIAVPDVCVYTLHSAGARHYLRYSSFLLPSGARPKITDHICKFADEELGYTVSNFQRSGEHTDRINLRLPMDTRPTVSLLERRQSSQIYLRARFLRLP